ncbi:prephenate dehydratase [Candidatus Sumerlaeota bacterium]|nr:prephenate dehydratase [Candidatus Sumerlaeota bacterium]
MAKRKTIIESSRERIDAIDRQLVKLLNERAENARIIGEQKANKGLEFYDPGRQRRVLQKVINSNKGLFPAPGLKAVFTEIMSSCLALENRIRVGYLGAEATFTHQAAICEFGRGAEYISMPDIPSLFQAIGKNQTDYSVVPIENSTGGVVHRTLDMFLDYDVCICNEIMLPISMSLLANCAKSKIKRIYSHPQSFLQCQTWLSRNLPQVQCIEVASTVEGIKMAAKEKDAAAIGSELASRCYGIKLLYRDIEDTKDNTTRFWVLSHRIAEPSGNDKTSLMFSVKDRPGALHQILQPVSRRHISLTKIESRPTKRKAWEYVFFCDLLGHITDTKVQNAIKQMEPQCIYLKVLGSYPCEVNLARKK